MFRPKIKFCILTVVTVVCTVISPGQAKASVAPAIEYLGQISSDLFAPTRLDVDGLGNLYVADVRRHAVYKFDKYGHEVAVFNGVDLSGAGLAVTKDGSRLYVAGTSQVFVLDAKTGALVAALGQGAGEFGKVGEIDLDADGFVFVADVQRLKVAVYNSAGVFCYPIGAPGTGLGQFRVISALAVDVTAKELYVADSAYGGTAYQQMVQVFNVDGTYKRKILASSGFGAKPVEFFGGMTFDEGSRGFFLDLAGADLRILGSASEYLKSYGVAGFGAGQLSNPTDVIYDAVSSRLFVANGSGRVEIFGIDGAKNPVNLNVAPGQPLPLSPVTGTEVSSLRPQLTYLNGEDVDALTYNVRIFRDNQLVVEYLGQSEGQVSSLTQVEVDLQENSAYSWQVQAFDGELTSTWSVAQTFYVNATQEAPATPSLLAPAPALVVDGNAEMTWTATVDPDPFDTVGYVLQIASDAAFATPLIEESLAGTTAVLRTLPGYEALTNGNSYFWRVKAIDNHGQVSEPGEARLFTYATTALKVSSNMPGARVFFSGNLGYAGRFAGEAPLELRDLAAGAVSIVVERAGFEPWAGQGRLSQGETVEVYAELLPAIAPIDLKARPLSVAGAKLVSGVDVVPVVVDFDNDGLMDLLTGEGSGIFTLYRGEAASEQPAFGSGVAIEVRGSAGATPVVVDWNNDGKKDLLTGTNVGTVLYYQNIGSETQPAFAEGVYVLDAGAPLSVGSDAVPVVFDFDFDGDKDLLVGSGSGSVLGYRNIGSDEAPVLVGTGPLMPAFSGNAAPFAVDWNSDGYKDLLVASNQHVYVCLALAAGGFAPKEVVTVNDDTVGKNGKPATGASYIGDRLRLFVYDVDGMKGKDLLVGNARGEVRLVRSNGKDLVVGYGEVLGQKVDQIAAAVAATGQQNLPALWTDAELQLTELRSLLVAGDFVAAQGQLDHLASNSSGFADIDRFIAELVKLIP